MKMGFFRNLAVGFALVAGLVGSGSSVEAGTIVYKASGRIEWRDTYQVGFDLLGLNGARFVFTVSFDDATIYRGSFPSIPIYNEPEADSVGDSLTISGSSKPGVNGTYSAMGGRVIFHPTLPGQFAGGRPFEEGGEYATFLVGGLRLRIEHLANNVTGPKVGDRIKISDFTTTDASAGFSSITPDTNSMRDTYRVRDFQASVAAVPEPSTLVASGIAMGCLVLRTVALHRGKRASR